MRHMNYKIQTLLQEGVSISTLENLTSDQINVLYERAKKSKKETKEEITTNDTQKALEMQKLDPNAKIKLTKETEVTERSVSKKQQQFFGIVRGMQKGDIPKKGKAGEEADEMKVKDVKDFASTKHKGLPKKKKTETKEDVKKLEEGIMRLIEGYLPPHTTKSELLNAIKRRNR